MIKTLANGRSVDCALKAEALLDEMEAIAASSGTLEQNPTLSVVPRPCWPGAKSGSPQGPEKAEEIVKMLEDKFKETGDMMYQPDAVAYGVLLGAWSETRRPDSGIRAQEVLNKIKEIETRSGIKICNAILYTNVIKAHWRSGAPYSAVNSNT
jgi:hypothetical protein